MATIIRPDGSREIVSPKEDTFTLEELRTYIGCEWVELIVLDDGKYMWINEEGKLSDHLPNPDATLLLQAAGGIPGDYIAGSAMITESDEVK